MGSLVHNRMEESCATGYIVLEVDKTYLAFPNQQSRRFHTS